LPIWQAVIGKHEEVSMHAPARKPPIRPNAPATGTVQAVFGEER
jgi:hypothetical protein